MQEGPVISEHLILSSGLISTQRVRQRLREKKEIFAKRAELSKFVERKITMSCRQSLNRFRILALPILNSFSSVTPSRLRSQQYRFDLGH
jgi:hypothetical protein